MAAEDHLSQPQFEGHYTPTFSTPHFAPFGSAYGTGHPSDIALGKAYRLRSLHGAAKGASQSHSNVATLASAIMKSGHMPSLKEEENG